MDGIRIGSAVETGDRDASPDPEAADLIRAALAWQADLPARVRRVAEESLVPVAPPDSPPPFHVPENALRRHGLIFGASGRGKTNLAALLVAHQLAGEEKASLVAVSPKSEDVYAMRAVCQEAGMRPQDVVLIDAERPETAPGMNPFRSGAGPGANAKVVTDILENAGAFTGDRMELYLLEAVNLAAWHRLPLTGVPRLLFDADFRQAVLAAEPFYEPGRSYDEAVSFFRDEFANTNQGDKKLSVTSARGQFRRLFRGDLMLRMFGSGRNAVDFPRLFERPGAVLVSVDTTGDTDLTGSGAALLAGIVSHLLLAAAGKWKGRGPCPVVLYIDEFGKVAGPIAHTLRDVANMARTRNVRLLLAAQHPEQIPEDLRRDLLVSSAVKAYFNPEDEYSAHAAARQVALKGDPPGIERVRLGPVRTVARERLTAVRIGDEWRDLQPVVADPRLRPSPVPIAVDPGRPGVSLKVFTEAATAIRPPIYLEGSGRRASEVFERMPYGTVQLVWRGGYAYAEVRLPTIETEKVRGGAELDAWKRTLMNLAVGEAVVSVGEGIPRKVAVDFRRRPPDAPEWFARKSERVAAHPQSGSDDVPPRPLPALPDSPEPEPAPVPEPDPPAEATAPKPKRNGKRPSDFERRPGDELFAD